VLAPPLPTVEERMAKKQSDKAAKAAKKEEARKVTAEKVRTLLIVDL
jgi:hypothetical protein